MYAATAVFGHWYYCQKAEPFWGFLPLDHGYQLHGTMKEVDGRGMKKTGNSWGLPGALSEHKTGHRRNQKQGDIYTYHSGLSVPVEPALSRSSQMTDSLQS